MANVENEWIVKQDDGTYMNVASHVIDANSLTYILAKEAEQEEPTQ